MTIEMTIEMTLDRQLQVLVEEAAQYGVAPIVMEKAIAPVFQLVAQQLEHLEYYVLQNLQEDWVISVLSDRAPRAGFVADRQKSPTEKKVIYAFATVKDAKNFRMSGESDLVAIPLPIVQILFRIFSLQQIDSAIFFNRSGNTTQGIEVKCSDLQNSIRQQLLQLKTIPPNLA